MLLRTYRICTCGTVTSVLRLPGRKTYQFHPMQSFAIRQHVDYGCRSEGLCLDVSFPDEKERHKSSLNLDRHSSWGLIGHTNLNQTRESAGGQRFQKDRTWC